MTDVPPPPPPPPPSPPSPPPPPGGGPAFPGATGAAPTGKTNGMAIASMVLGIVGVPLCCLFIPSILGVVFGFISLNQIKADPTQRGRGMAIAGIVLGFVIIALMLVGILFGDGTYEYDFGDLE